MNQLNEDERDDLFAWTSADLNENRTTSIRCATHLSLFFQDHANLAIATEASSHPAGLTALYYQPWQWAGGGLGNIAECPLQTCIAGAGIRRDSLNFASLCIVPECTAEDLAADDFVSVTQRASVGAEDSFLGNDYAHVVERIHELNKFLQTGWTCGDFVVPWTIWPFGALFFVVATFFIVCTTISSLCRAKKTAIKAEMDLQQHVPSVLSVLERRQNEEAWSDDDGNLSPTASSEGEFFSSIASNEYWRAFDVFSNMKELMTRKSNDTVVMDGLRVGSLCWIVLGHVMAIRASVSGFANPKDVYPPSGYLASLPGQLVISSRFAVDTFLIISGFLTFHVLNRKLKRKPNDDRGVLRRYLTSLPGLLLVRVVRIMPLYGMSLLFYTQIAPHLGGGPFWYQWLALLEPCHDYGWTNILFINNLVPFDLATTQTCFYHSWYLAVDMQLFLLSAGLIFWYQENPIHGKRATAVFWTLSTAVGTYLAAVRGWSINTFDGAAVARYDVEAYAKPHIRAQSYLTGVFVAMLLTGSAATKRCHFSWRERAIQNFCLLSMLVVAFIAAAGAYTRRPCQYSDWPDEIECGSEWSDTVTWTYTSMSRTVWCLCIGSLMYIFIGRPSNSSPVSYVLSWGIWAPLSRLSFAAYLIHPIIIFLWELGSTEKAVFRPFTFVMNVISICVASYTAALVATLLIEMPAANLWKIRSARGSDIHHKKRDEEHQLASTEQSSLLSENSPYGSTNCKA